jgi:hypothetical protein
MKIVPLFLLMLTMAGCGYRPKSDVQPCLDSADSLMDANKKLQASTVALEGALTGVEKQRNDLLGIVKRQRIVIEKDTQAMNLAAVEFERRNQVVLYCKQSGCCETHGEKVSCTEPAGALR